MGSNLPIGKGIKYIVTKNCTIIFVISVISFGLPVYKFILIACIFLCLFLRSRGIFKQLGMEDFSRVHIQTLGSEESYGPHANTNLVRFDKIHDPGVSGLYMCTVLSL